VSPEWPKAFDRCTRCIAAALNIGMNTDAAFQSEENHPPGGFWDE
jgi:hypothetical protein